MDLSKFMSGSRFSTGGGPSGVSLGPQTVNFANGGLTVTPYPKLNNGNPITVGSGIAQSTFAPLLLVATLGGLVWWYGRRS
jgi:hypothetical protein